MSLRLLIDEDTQDARLVLMLRTEGRDIVTVNEAGLQGQPDSVVLAHAATDQRIVLTMNCRDFWICMKPPMHIPASSASIKGVTRVRT